VHKLEKARLSSFFSHSVRAIWVGDDPGMEDPETFTQDSDMITDALRMIFSRPVITRALERSRY